MKKWADIMRNVSMLSQLGLSLIMPLLLCMLGCYVLTTYAGVGAWVYMIGIFFGLGGSCATAYQFYQMTMKKERKNDRADGTSFNAHK